MNLTLSNYFKQKSAKEFLERHSPDCLVLTDLSMCGKLLYEVSIQSYHNVSVKSRTKVAPTFRPSPPPAALGAGDTLPEVAFTNRLKLTLSPAGSGKSIYVFH
jgi:hypothetical protein